MVFLLFSICPVAEVGSCANRKHVSAILNAKTGEGVRNGMGPISQDLACYFQKIVTGCTEVCRVPFQILKLSLFWHYSVMRQATVSPEERVLVISVYKTLVNPKSTVAELKQRLIEKISKTDDESLLEDIYSLIEVDEQVGTFYHLSDSQLVKIENAQQEIKEGNFFTNEEVDKEIDEWLGK